MKRFQKDNKKPIKSYTRGNIVGIFGLFRTFFPAEYCQIANISLMKQRNALFLCFIFWAGIVTAQTDTFELSSYKARYERRPAMFLDGAMAFDGNYADRKSAFNSGLAAARLNWQELRNTDELASFWSFSGDMEGTLNLYSSAISGRYNTAGIDVYSLWNRRHYRQDNRFWGWAGTFRADGNLSSLRENDRRFYTYLTPAVFRGRGRIEYAEDALLSSWMLEDLQKAGVIGSYSGSDITTLARTITDIIGNRTFDLRRRRIYELERLQGTLLELGLSEEGNFQLFAILNDNWAFANRNYLPHGNRLTYGVEGTAYHRWSRFEEAARNTFACNGLAFLEYIHGRVINNRSGSSWVLRAQGGYQQIMDKLNKEEWEAPREGLFAMLSAGYTYRWFPSSRTSLTWTNTASMDWGERDSGATNTLGGLVEFDQRADWISNLELDYFINYQWSFQLRARASMLYRMDPGLLSFNPSFSFNTVYYFF